MVTTEDCTPRRGRDEEIRILSRSGSETSWISRRSSSLDDADKDETKKRPKKTMSLANLKLLRRKDSSGSSYSSCHDTETLFPKTELKEWKMVRVLGKGATGKVILAKIIGVKKEKELPGSSPESVCAIKLVRHKTFRETLMNEILVLRSVSSPYVVKGHGVVVKHKQHNFGIEKGGYLTLQQLGLKSDLVLQSYLRENMKGLVLEYCSEGCLSNDYKLYGTLKADLKSTVQDMVDMAEGLVALHAQRFTHFDVKLANFIRSGERVKITDFGMTTQWAPALDDESPIRQEAALEYKGSKAYASPELLVIKSHLFYAVDSYALGSTYVQLLENQLWRDRPMIEPKYDKEGMLKIMRQVRVMNSTFRDNYEKTPTREMLEANVRLCHQKLHCILNRIHHVQLRELCCGLMSHDINKRWTSKQALAAARKILASC